MQRGGRVFRAAETSQVPRFGRRRGYHTVRTVRARQSLRRRRKLCATATSLTSSTGEEKRVQAKQPAEAGSGDELVWRGSGLAGVAAWSAVCTASGLRRWSRRSASRVPPRALLVNDDTAGLAVQYLRQYCGRRNLRLLMHGCKLRSYRTLTVPKHR